MATEPRQMEAAREDGLLVQLLRHMCWADARVWEAIEVHGDAADDAFIRERMHHVHAVQAAYLACWRGNTPLLSEVVDFDTAGAIRRWGEQEGNAVRAFVEQCGAVGLGQPVDLPWATSFAGGARPAPPPTLAETAVQVAMHSAYHRGQVNTRLRELGGVPPTVDFVVWIWEGRPPP